MTEVALYHARLELMQGAREILHIGTIRFQQEKGELRTRLIPDSWEKRYYVDEAFQGLGHSVDLWTASFLI
jgi:hypothetical protein